MFCLDRKEKKIKVVPYKQSLLRGCGPSSLLMILHTYDPQRFPLIPEKEKEIYDFAKFEENGSTAIPGLALYSLNHGFRARIYTCPDYPINAPHISPEVYFESLRKYKEFESEALSKGLDKVCGDFSMEDLISKEIYKGNLVLLFIQLDNIGKVTHNIVVRGHKSNKILCVDPLSGDYLVREKRDIERMRNVQYVKIALAIENAN